MREAQLKRVTKHLKHVEIIKQESIDCHIIIVMQCLRHIKNRSVRTCHFMIYTHRSPPRPRGFCLFFRLFVWGFWFFYGYFFFKILLSIYIFPFFWGSTLNCTGSNFWRRFIITVTYINICLKQQIHVYIDNPFWVHFEVKISNKWCLV